MPHGTIQDSSSRVDLQNLALEHYTALERAVSTLLSTKLAAETFAQVVDGIPIRDVYKEYYGYRRKDFNNHISPSQPALEAVESYRQNFNIGSLQLDTKAAQAYQNTTKGSRDFNLRLLEALAVICHDIAVRLYYQYEGGLHRPDPESIHQQILVPELPPSVILAPVKSKPAELFHPSYQNWKRYPHGLADIVGYWVEYRLFGGVVLFDRGENSSACSDAFIHPIGRYQIFQLSDVQIRRYVGFLLLEGIEPESGEIRFHAEKYARRIDPYDAMHLHIYRDRYEREIPEVIPVRCVGRGEDMPGYEESLKDLARRSGRE
ncbi:hypothetical protein FQN54_003891 [Arachnomyces sp. PD_36]|nr:hypothetical protein FQN54_003891 [Arachnomyces sp. PD_36]